ncbi:MAG: VWA domain-containing protein [Kiritimatiellae bacterium]|nr:VWA domain-containing protein [Kiritimatiellia bacterium]
MQFLSPGWLLFLWAIPPAAVVLVSMRMARTRTMALLGSQAAAAAKRGNRVFYTQLALVLTALALAVVALARPWWGERDEETFVSSRNVLVLLDVSRSMLAQDVRPSRLGRAKADLADLARDLDGDRVCLVAFRADSQVLCPFTTDTGFFLEALDGAMPDSAARGETDLGGALSAALAAFKGREGDHNAILLVSDGEDLAGGAAAVAHRCAEAHIPVFCIGMGASAGAAIPDGDGGRTLHHGGEEVVTRLDSATLKTVSEVSGGVYLPLASTSTGARTLGSIYRKHVRTLVENDERIETERRRVERYGVFLLPAIVMFIAAAMLSGGRPLRRRAPVSAAGTAGATASLAFAVLLAAANASAGRARDIARDAQRLFAEGDAAQAHTRYEEALAAVEKDETALEDDIRLNSAIAALAAGDADKAAERFRSLPPSFEASSGLGAALFKLAQEESAKALNSTGRVSVLEKSLTLAQDAASAFSDAAGRRPGDDAAATNLATAVSSVQSLRTSLAEARFEEKFGGKSPGELLAQTLALQRKSYAEAALAEQDSTPSAIAKREKAAVRQREAAEAWQPLREALAQLLRQSVTNESEIAALEARLADAADAASGAADALESMLPDFLPAMRDAELAAFSLQPLFADPLLLLSLALEAQSNALSRVANPAAVRTPVEDENAASWLFDAFSGKIEPWLNELEEEAENKAPAEAGDADDGDNAKLAAEMRAEVRRLCSETSGTFSLLKMALDPGMSVLPEDQLPNARQIAVNLDALLKLLSPPQPPQQSQQEKQDSQDSKDSQDSQDSQNSQDSQEAQNSQDSQNAQDSREEEQGERDQDNSDNGESEQETRQEESGEEEPQTAEGEPEEQGEDESGTAADETEERDPDSDMAQALMQRLLDQEKERAEQKRARRHSLPPKVGERDW